MGLVVLRETRTHRGVAAEVLSGLLQQLREADAPIGAHDRQTRAL
jgi:hypothetical protein